MIATPFSLAGPSAPTTSTAASNTPLRAASPVPAQPGKEPFTWMTALNRASLWFSQSRTTWATAGHTLS
ncbi:hypothetical protein [Rhodoferax sp.]|uniref:hypothetical protein n=1 Tax=Rhodoferax sp. TaxID=50421 RepID=UPI0025D4B203|nr:hypothetical protein [Rhodoferax sp.]